jgi:hypothetical protein
MKKNDKKLALSTSTVRRLSTVQLEDIGGGATTYPTLCNCNVYVPTAPINTGGCK